MCNNWANPHFTIQKHYNQLKQFQAKSRENKKVFVGGIPADHPEEELRKYFEQFGKVDDVEWP